MLPVIYSIYLKAEWEVTFKDNSEFVNRLKEYSILYFMVNRTFASVFVGAYYFATKRKETILFFMQME